ncbi:hypothetical protein [Paenibacillus larvae]|uniref:N-acetyltransferase domain-containing protein n=1 Tax=Paenibacillus larvae subsp. larvae TaxID=147375 RepID=A0A2L1U7F7_9BACL|nr:hypothetical protein [Paenibacillus larvae]AVF28869.1 hypothetical protein ERICIII_04867 [Paenibacillus larvae subsp. larvae]MCY9502430.1 hypothetical protein [Paenibacillus larvae]MCY9746368.1 hypothetical protein [Paenibacillus larvae]MCY9752090.1 hypothetical protein [Paenibacillus larvae]MDR5608764.1 hypothetical protein [Paenibacillus larvae]
MADLEFVVYSGEYDRKEFYSHMGKYFAEDQYKRQLPYLKNQDGKVWFVAFGGGEVAAFSSLQEKKNKIVFSSGYVEERYRKSGVWEQMIKLRLDYVSGSDKPIEIATDKDYLVATLKKYQFNMVRETKNYTFMERVDE